MNKEEHPIYVIRPFLPSHVEFLPWFEQIWQTRELTNNGPSHQVIKKNIYEYIIDPFISLFANAILTLLTSIQALNIRGVIIAIPFNFVATINSLWLKNMKHLFLKTATKYNFTRNIY